MSPQFSNGVIKAEELLFFFLKFSIYLISISLIIAGLFFLTGFEIGANGLCFWLSWIIACGILYWEYSRYSGKKTLTLLLYLAGATFIFFILTLVISVVYDKSWDGLTYHQLGILNFYQWWNPVYDVLPYEVIESEHYDYGITLNLWINHYPKGSELFSAVLMAVTGNIESGKIYNLLLFLGSFASVFYVLKYTSVSLLWRFTAAFAASFNPIIINQLFSYYLDGALGALLLIMICQFFLLLKGSKSEKFSALLLIFFSLVFLINLKFTGLVYGAWFCLGFIILLWLLKEYSTLKSFFYTTAASTLVAVLIVGFNPYVINTLEYGHPFYPLAGKNKVDIITTNIPPQLMEANRVEKFLISTFSESDNFDINSTNEKTLDYKVPFTFSVAELKMFQSEGIRLGGFGVFWSGIFILTILLLIFVFLKSKDYDRLLTLFFLGSVLGSVLINPESWWARYIPQLWLVPVFAALYLIIRSRKKWLTIMAKAVLVLSIFNTALIAVVYSYSALKQTYEARKELKKLQKTGDSLVVYLDVFQPNMIKLDEYNIEYRKVKDPENMQCEMPDEVFRIEYCKE